MYGKTIVLDVSVNILKLEPFCFTSRRDQLSRLAHFEPIENWSRVVIPDLNRAGYFSARFNTLALESVSDSVNSIAAFSAVDLVIPISFKGISRFSHAKDF